MHVRGDLAQHLREVLNMLGGDELNIDAAGSMNQDPNSGPDRRTTTGPTAAHPDSLEVAGVAGGIG